MKINSNYFLFYGIFLIFLSIKDSLAEIVFSVEPIKFVANIPDSLSRNLCINRSLGTSNYIPVDCKGIQKELVLPDAQGFLTKHEYWKIGEQYYPTIDPEALAAQLISELKKQTKFKLVDYKQLLGNRFNTKRVLIRGVITEASSDVQESESGFGGAVISLFYESHIKKGSGYVRMDISALDLDSGEYLCSFSVPGAFYDQLSESGLGATGIYFSSEFTTKLISQATREALSHAASNLALELAKWE